MGHYTRSHTMVTVTVVTLVIWVALIFLCESLFNPENGIVADAPKIFFRLVSLFFIFGCVSFGHGCVLNMVGIEPAESTMYDSFMETPIYISERMQSVRDRDDCKYMDDETYVAVVTAVNECQENYKSATYAHLKSQTEKELRRCVDRAMKEQHILIESNYLIDLRSIDCYEGIISVICYVGFDERLLSVKRATPIKEYPDMLNYEEYIQRIGK